MRLPLYVSLSKVQEQNWSCWKILQRQRSLWQETRLNGWALRDWIKKLWKNLNWRFKNTRTVTVGAYQESLKDKHALLCSLCLFVDLLVGLSGGFHKTSRMDWSQPRIAPIKFWCGSWWWDTSRNISSISITLQEQDLSILVVPLMSYL